MLNLNLNKNIVWPQPLGNEKKTVDTLFEIVS